MPLLGWGTQSLCWQGYDAEGNPTTSVDKFNMESERSNTIQPCDPPPGCSPAVCWLPSIQKAYVFGESSIDHKLTDLIREYSKILDKWEVLNVKLP